MNKYKVKQESYYGFDHKAVNSLLEGDLSFCAEMCVNGEYHPVAVYKAKNPNVKKGHKKYVLLQKQGDGGWVRGMTTTQMNKERYQQAVLCKNCNTILYSINRHHFHNCGCANETFVDGGKDYLRCGGKDMTKIKTITLDLLTMKIKEKSNAKRKR